MAKPKTTITETHWEVQRQVWDDAPWCLQGPTWHRERVARHQLKGAQAQFPCEAFRLVKVTTTRTYLS